MAVGREEVTQLLSSAWESVLGLPLHPRSAEGGLGNGEAGWTGCVRITGRWQGAVILEFPIGLAGKAAARLFGLDLQAVAATDVQETVRELSNIIGGNIKALLPGPSSLSLPEVVDGVPHRPTDRCGLEVFRGTYACEEGHFVVKVLAAP